MPIPPEHQAILDAADKSTRKLIEAEGDDPDLVLLEMDEFGAKVVRDAGLRDAPDP